MKLRRSEPFVWGWQKKGAKIGFFTMLLCVVAFFGCSDRKKISETLNRKKKTDALQISAHFENYKRLKEKDPVGARGELYVASHLLHKGHEKSDLWAELVFEMDEKGTLTLDRLLTFEKLQLELAIDKGTSEDMIQTQKAVVASTQARIDALIAEGKDPKQVQVKGYRFDFSPDP